MLWSEDMLRPPDSRVDLVPELMALVREPTFVRPSYRSIGMLGGCQSPPNNFAQVGSKDPPAQRNWKGGGFVELASNKTPPIAFGWVRSSSFKGHYWGNTSTAAQHADRSLRGSDKGRFPR